MSGALKYRSGAVWNYVKGIKGDTGPAGPPSVGLTTLTSSYDQTIRQTGPRGGPYQLLFRKNKEAYLNDRNDVDATGATDMGTTISTYLSEWIAAGVRHVILDAGSTYGVGSGSTITLPGQMALHGPLTGSNAAPWATIKPLANGVTLITNGDSGNNGAAINGVALDLGSAAGQTGTIGIRLNVAHTQRIQQCFFINGDATSTAVQGGDILYFTFRENVMNNLAGMGLDLQHSDPRGYYGVNFGIIERNLFSGQAGALRVSGICDIIGNDFEAGSGLVGPAITIGQTGMHTDAHVESNYFEAGKYHILATSDSTRARIVRNDMYGHNVGDVGSYGIKWNQATDWYNIQDNFITAVETGIILPQLTATTAGGFLGPQRFGTVTTFLTGGDNGSNNGASNVRASLQFRGDNRITYNGALAGGGVLHASAAADFALDLAKGTLFHIQTTANLTLTGATNNPGVPQPVTVTNTGTGTITLPFTVFKTREGVDALLLPGQTRTFTTLLNGFGGTTKLVEVGPIPIKPPVTKTATFTADTSADTYLCDATTGAITANLPSATTWTGGPLTIKKTDSSANAVTVDPNGTQTIDGATTLALTTQWSAVTVRPSGGNYLVVGKV